MPKEFSDEENRTHYLYARKLLRKNNKKKSIVKKLVKKGYTSGHAEFLVDAAFKDNFMRDRNRIH